MNYVRKFQTGGATDPTVGNPTGTESSLSSWAGDYVTGMLGKGQALANQDYQARRGPPFIISLATFLPNPTGSIG